MGKPKAPTAWEIAKPLLEKDYLDGTITDDMRRGVVHKMRPEYTAVKIDNFGNNFLKMKRDIKAFKDKAEEDHLALLNDRILHPPTEGRWDGSEAQKQLKEHINQGYIPKGLPGYKTPSKLWSDNAEYKKFGLDKFRGHIHQERRSRIESNYWLNKKAKKDRKRAKALFPEADSLEFFVDMDDY